MTNKVLITCSSLAYLAPLKMMGPIVSPLAIEKPVVSKLVMSGAVIMLHKEDKTSVRLTPSNLSKELDGSNECEECKLPTVVKEKNITVEATPDETITTPLTQGELPEDSKVIEVGEVSHEDLSPVGEEVLEVPTEPVATVTETPQSKPVFDINAIEFTKEEDGTIDVKKFDFTPYSNNQAKKIRAKIKELNSAEAK